MQRIHHRDDRDRDHVRGRRPCCSRRSRRRTTSLNLVGLSLIAGVVNGLIKPIVKLISLPVTLVTFGLFGLVINAGLLLLIAWLAEPGRHPVHRRWLPAAT